MKVAWLGFENSTLCLRFVRHKLSKPLFRLPPPLFGRPLLWLWLGLGFSGSIWFLLDYPDTPYGMLLTHVLIHFAF